MKVKELGQLMSLESEFTAALRGTYDAAGERGYVATYFLQMIEEHRGVETAKRLLAKKDAQNGLNKLWELDLLCNSMEAAVLQERFQVLFTASEITKAK